MTIEVDDYFEYNKDKYLVLHKNHNEITVVIQTLTDIIIQIKDINFFNKPEMKKKLDNPFCNIKNLIGLLQGLQKHNDIMFLGYVKCYHPSQNIKKIKRHDVYQLLFQIENKYLSLMVAGTPAYELLTDYYYTSTWGYNLEKKEIFSLMNIDGVTKETVITSTSKDYTVIKEPLKIEIDEHSVILNSMIKIYTDLRINQVELLNRNSYAFVLEDKDDFISRFHKEENYETT